MVTRKPCCRRETARRRCKFWSIPSPLALCWSNISQSNAVSQWMYRVCVNTVCLKKQKNMSYGTNRKRVYDFLLRLTYSLACLLHTIITIRVVSNAGLSRSVRMSLIVISFRQFWIWIWIIIANLLTDISAMDSFICWDNILLFISLC